MNHIKQYGCGLLLLLCCFMWSCKHVPHTVTRGFYYWKTTYKPTAYETKTLHSLHCIRMYLRLFDVDWSTTTNTMVPLAPVRVLQQVDMGFTYIPVIFITQSAQDKIADTLLPALAANIASLASQMCAAARINPTEIQIDCDWTGRTKEKYFALLRNLKQQPFFKGKALSCTIRTYQVKYTRHCGIPPVDKGMLMCYNMGTIKKYNSRNSIIDADEAKLYFKYLDTYPLQLDIALPLFRWCLLFREGRFKGILRDVQPDQVAGNAMFTRLKDNVYRSTVDTSWQGYYLKRDDVIRTEEPTVETLDAIANYTAKHVKNKALNVVFFACDSLNLSKYPIDELEKIYTAYR